MWMVNSKDLPGIILLKYCKQKVNSIVNQINLGKYKTEVLILRKRKRDYQKEKVSRLVVILLTKFICVLATRGQI